MLDRTYALPLTTVAAAIRKRGGRHHGCSHLCTQNAYSTAMQPSDGAFMGWSPDCTGRTAATGERKTMKTAMAFFAGIILGGIVTGVLVDKMASKMWIDMHVQTKAAELTQTVKGLEALHDGNLAKGVGILERKIDSDLQYRAGDLNDLNISAGTRESFGKALDRAEEYRRRHPKKE